MDSISENAITEIKSKIQMALAKIPTKIREMPISLF